MRPDSLGQLAQAQQGLFFGDHHPPAMSIYWYLLGLIKTGPGPMLISHLLCLFGAAFFLSRCFKGLARWYYIPILFFPSVLSYAGFILKDVSFATSYLLSVGILTYHTVYRKRVSLGSLTILLLSLFYGTAVKYQAIFLLPLMAFWTASAFNAYRFNSHLLWKGLSLWCALWGGIALFNSWAIPTKDHSWQFVKLYDLAAISLDVKEDLIPDPNKARPFSLEGLHQEFNEERVDELVFGPSVLLIKGKTEEERDFLWNHWLKTVFKHPGAYLKHRIRLSLNLLTSSPIKPLAKVKSHQDEISGPVKKLLHTLETFGVIDFLRHLTSFYLYLPLILLYLALGRAAHRKKNVYGTPLILLNALSLLPVIVLFVFSMASDAPRYLYFSVCCFHFSHPFAWMCWKEY